MSFFDMKDPEERDAVIEDYLALKKRLKERNMADRGYLIDRQRDLEETFRPVIVSNEKMVQDIIKDLAPITEGLEEINRNIEMKKEKLRPKIGSKRRFVSGDYGLLAESFLRKYMDGVVDRSFGIRYENGHFMMTDKVFKIHGDNIMLDDKVDVRTPGLWTLITDKSPKTYTKEDYERYKELLHETNVMYRDCDPKSSYSRANRSTKWNKVLRPI